MATCAWCGDDIGDGPNNSREPESCGKKECQREVRGMYREMQEDAEERAREDGYDRYR